MLYLFRDTVKAHENFRGRPVDNLTFVTPALTRSHDRFGSLLKLYSEGRDRQPIRQELHNLLNPCAENIALVIAQGAIALLVKSKADFVLNRVKEAREE
jgi:hypothetical protein